MSTVSPNIIVFLNLFGGIVRGTMMKQHTHVQEVAQLTSELIVRENLNFMRRISISHQLMHLFSGSGIPFFDVEQFWIQLNFFRTISSNSQLTVVVIINRLHYILPGTAHKVFHNTNKLF